MDKLSAILERLGQPQLGVLGDVILDRYTWGDAERVSPEAPVIVLNVSEQEERLGGAASVASLLRSLDASAFLVGVSGMDKHGERIRELLSETGIDNDGVLFCDDRPTTMKERFIGLAASRHPHQILRVDHEVCGPISLEAETHLAEEIERRLEGCQGFIVSDYAKGVCTPALLTHAINSARRRNIPTIVDPAPGVDFDRYRGASILTPNRREAEQASGERIMSPRDALNVGRTLCERYQVEAVAITLDRDGIALIRRGKESRHFPTLPREVYDVTGAGDTVVAVIGLCLAAGISLLESIPLSNLAAGRQVEKLGVVGIRRQDISAAARSSTRGSALKLVEFEQLAALAKSYRVAGRKIVLTNGSFDSLHIGHVTHLQQASQLADVLIVAVSGDSSVTRIKGAGRPVVSALHRAGMIAALECVDYVVILEEDTPHALLHAIRPDLLVKGGAHDANEVVGKDIVESYGGRVQMINHVKDVSTIDYPNALHVP